MVRRRSSPAALWGDPAHGTELFAPHGFADVLLEPETLRIWEGPLEGLVELYETTMGPVVTARARLGEERWPAARAELERVILRFADRDADGVVKLDADYVTLLVRR